MTFENDNNNETTGHCHLKYLSDECGKKDRELWIKLVDLNLAVVCSGKIQICWRSPHVHGW